MAKAILLVDAIAWIDEDGVRQEADGKGSEVDLPADAFKHHEEAGNVAAPRSKAAKEAAEGESEEPGE
jgi:hypothetical protein